MCIGCAATWYFANVDVLATYGASALNLAATRGHLSCVVVLLEHGARLDTALNEKCLFFAPCVSFTPLHAAAIGGHSDIIEKLLKGRSDPNSVSSLGATPLHCVLATTESVQGVQLLLDYGANKDLRCSEDYPLRTWKMATPLDIAKSKGFGKVAKLLTQGSRYRCTENHVCCWTWFGCWTDPSWDQCLSCIPFRLGARHHQ